MGEGSIANVWFGITVLPFPRRIEESLKMAGIVTPRLQINLRYHFSRHVPCLQLTKYVPFFVHLALFIAV
jgi:hypothetical protein